VFWRFAILSWQNNISDCQQEEFSPSLLDAGLKVFFFKIGNFLRLAKAE
jgi:hypothetical protein